MAHWLEFTEDYDHKWPSGAVTAFKAGMKVYVKREVAEAAKGIGVAKPTKKPEEGDASHVTTPRRDEGQRFKPGQRTMPAVKRSGHGYDETGNPISLRARPLEPADDPKAKRSEPIMATDRHAQRVKRAEGEEPPVEEAASQVDAVDEGEAGKAE